MKTKLNINPSVLFCFFISIFFFGCTGDIFEKNISKKTVHIFSPQDGLKTTANQVTFWWQKVDGAEKYNIQIATPSFSQPVKLLLDSSVTTDQFTHIFSPGTYEWRVKAYNNGSETVYSSQTFTIDSTGSLSSLIVSTSSPANNYITKNKAITFNWYALNNATYYNIVLTDASGGTIKDTALTALSYVYHYTQDGVYYWKVKAFNSSSISQFSNNNKLTIDNLAPSSPGLTSPADGALVKDTINLIWSRTGTDVAYDSVYVASDLAFTTLLVKNKIYNIKIKISALSPQLTVSSNFYYWKVKSCDSLGNASSASQILKFKLQ